MKDKTVYAFIQRKYNGDPLVSVVQIIVYLVRTVWLLRRMELYERQWPWMARRSPWSGSIPCGGQPLVAVETLRVSCI